MRYNKIFDQETFRCIVLGSVIDSDLDSVSVSIFCGGTRPSRASSHRTQGSTGLASFSSGSRFRSIYSSARRQPPRHETSSLETIRRTHSVSGITVKRKRTRNDEKLDARTVQFFSSLISLRFTTSEVQFPRSSDLHGHPCGTPGHHSPYGPPGFP